jgi:catechol 2,3-dioxygenase-like lactoylglutathione lyase family enzyme
MPSTVNVRYMVDDVDAAVAFYTRHLGFTLLSSAAPAFADVARGDLRLLLSGAAIPPAIRSCCSSRRSAESDRRRGSALRDARWRAASATT